MKRSSDHLCKHQKKKKYLSPFPVNLTYLIATTVVGSYVELAPWVWLDQEYRSTPSSHVLAYNIDTTDKYSAIIVKR